MDTNKVAILLKKASLAAERVQGPILQGYGLTVSQYKILKYLYAAPEDSVRLVDLEDFYSMTHPAVIDVIKETVTANLTAAERIQLASLLRKIMGD